MKILVINQHVTDVFGGSEIQCDLIAEGLHKRGHDVLYLAVNGKCAKYNRGYRVEPTQLSEDHITRICRDFAPDIVYWRYNKHHFLRSVRIISSQKVPVVFSISHISDVKRWHIRERLDVSSLRGIKRCLLTLKSTLVNYYNHRGFAYIDGVVSLNPDFLNKVPVSKQTLIHDFVHSDLVPFAWSRPFCVWIANIKARKNPEKFVDLAREILQRDQSVDFLMIGKMGDSQYEWIRGVSKTYSNFHYLGPKTLEEVNGVLQASLFLVHTCEPEGFGDNFIQAWQQGKPTVSLYFDPGGYIRDKEIGYASGTPKRFSADVERLIGDTSLRETMGKRAQEFATAKFSPEKNITAFEEFFFEVIKEHTPANS